MSEFTIQCPQCQTLLIVQDEWVNMQTTCPNCNTKVIVPPRENTALQQQTVAATVQTQPEYVNNEMVINDNIKATPAKISEFLRAVVNKQEEFLILGTENIFIQIALNKNGSLSLEYKDADNELHYSTSSDVKSVERVLLKFFRQDYSFLNDLQWESKALETDQAANKKPAEPMTPSECITAVVVIVGIICGIMAIFFFSCPRTTFWIGAPLIALCGVFAVAEDHPKCKLAGGLVLVGVIALGWYAHTGALQAVLQKEQQEKIYAANCSKIGIELAREQVRKSSGNTVYITREWEFVPYEHRHRFGEVSENCRYVINPKYIGEDIKKINPETPVLSCQEHEDNIVRAGYITRD